MIRVKIVEQNLNHKTVIQYYMMLRTLDPGEPSGKHNIKWISQHDIPVKIPPFERFHTLHIPTLQHLFWFSRPFRTKKHTSSRPAWLDLDFRMDPHSAKLLLHAVATTRCHHSKTPAACPLAVGQYSILFFGDASLEVGITVWTPQKPVQFKQSNLGTRRNSFFCIQ